MGKKPLTVKEMARMGGLARAKAYGKPQIRKWGKRGGRPPKLNARGLARVRRWLAEGITQEVCAQRLGVSTRTVGRALAAIRRRHPG